MEPKNEIIVCLDIGASTLKGLVVEIKEDFSLEIIAHATEESKGFKRGIIVDFELLCSSVGKLIEKLENMSNYELERVFATITGEHIYSINSSATIKISRPNKEINREEIGRLIYEAKNVNIPSGKEILHVIPISFNLDGMSGIRDPYGMTGETLGVDVHIITVDSKYIQNYRKIFERNNLEIDDFVFQGFSSAESIITEEEKETGMLILDFGSGTIDGIIYKNGGPVYSKSWPWAGELITKDISLCLDIPFSEAQKVKEKYGLASVSLLEKNEMLEVVVGEEKKRFSRQYLCEVIESRLPEILSLIWKDIEQPLMEYKIPVITITGGESLLPGLTSMWKEALNEAGLPLQVKNGYPQILDPIRIINVPAKLKSPVYSALLGTLITGTYNKLGEKEIVGENLLKNMLKHTKQLIKKLLKGGKK